MKSVMLSIRPEWVEKIANGEKTVEVRKTVPKLETPFKCYIYCTTKGIKDDAFFYYNKGYKQMYGLKGFVIGEFICDFFDEFTMSERGVRLQRFRALYETRLGVKGIRAYANGKTVYGWHISDLVIYDKPKELSEFGKRCNENANCFYCTKSEFYGWNCNGRIAHAPQSWCYCEVLDERS